MDENRKSAFEQAAQDVTKLAQEPDVATRLRLYCLYKQSTRGDCSGARPGWTDMAARAKYDAWMSVAGMPANEAMQAYIELVEELKRAQPQPT